MDFRNTMGHPYGICPSPSAHFGAMSLLKTLWATKGMLGWVCFALWGCLGHCEDDQLRN
jgi:hypothetical protein